VFIEWNDLLLDPSFTMFQDGNELVFNNMENDIGMKLSTCHTLDKFSPNGLLRLNRQIWAERDFQDYPRSSCLFTICPLTDFVLHYVKKETRQFLCFLPCVLIELITNYIGVSNVEILW